MDRRAAGGGVKGPFIPLLRSPELVDRLGKVGEHLRFGSSLEARISELVMLTVSRQWTNQFEWAVHVPLALKNGVKQEVIDALAEGRYPKGLAQDEVIAYEVGLIDIVTVYGYFVTVCAIMNVAHTPPPADTKVAPILPFPL